MQSLAAAAIGLLIGASILVAVRLIALHRRTGALPELLLGGMLLLSVGVGYPLRIAADQVAEPWASPFLVVSHFAIAFGFSLLYVFTWRVFQPAAAWARALTATGVIAGLGSAVRGWIQVHDRGVIPTIDASMADVLLETMPVLVAYVWTAWESLRFHRSMRRRVKLGLADVTVSNRFLLWGVMGLCATVGVVLNTTALAMHVDVRTPGILLASSVTGLGQAVLLVLAFVPPRSYLGWVRARATAGSAG